MQLLKTQKNDVFQLIESKGLIPNEFIWVVEGKYGKKDGEIYDESNWTDTLNHQPTGGTFKFNMYRFVYHDVSIKVAYKPCCGMYELGNYNILQHRYTAEEIIAINNNHMLNYEKDKELSGYKWWKDGIHGHVKTWLDEVDREATAPNLWDALSQEKALIASPLAQNGDNSKFTPVEQTVIADRLKSIYTEMRDTAGLTTEQLGNLKLNLDYLRNAAETIGRKDWTLLLVGTLTSYIISWSLGSGVGQLLFRVAGKALGWVTNQSMSLPLGH